MKNFNGHEQTFSLLKPSQVLVDHKYQREIDEKRVDKIVKEFDGDVFNAPKVSRRKDGKYYVFDGQHSLAAWKKMCGIHRTPDAPLSCRVYTNMTWEDEVRAFLKQNGFDKDPSSVEFLRAKYAMEDPDVVDMVDGARICGFIIDFSQSQADKRICALKSLFSSYQKLGYAAYIDMLSVLMEAWNGRISSTQGSIINGLCAFYQNFYGKFNHDDLVAKLQGTSPEKILLDSKTYIGVQGQKAVMRAILQTFNYRRTSKKLVIES